MEGPDDKKMGTYNYKMFKCFNRKFTITEPGPPQDVKEAFAAFAGGGADRMSVYQLWRFMVEHQGEVDWTLPDVQRIVDDSLQLLRRNRNCDSADQSKEKGLSVDDFFHFLFLDDYNGALKNQVNFSPRLITEKISLLVFPFSI